jgi:hypothetical protein
MEGIEVITAPEYRLAGVLSPEELGPTQGHTRNQQNCHGAA